MNWLTRRTSDGTYGVALGCFLSCTIVACRLPLLDNLNLTIETSRSTFDERNIGSQTHLINMPSRIQVIQSVEDHCEALEPVHIELRILDVRMMRLQLYFRVELMRRILSNL